MLGKFKKDNGKGIVGNFFDYLFTNVGGKIKKITRIVCIICIAIIYIGAVVFLCLGMFVAMKNNDFGYFLVSLVGAPLIFIIGTFFCWLSCAFTYILGANAENIEKLSKAVEQINDKMAD